MPNIDLEISNAIFESRLGTGVPNRAFFTLRNYEQDIATNADVAVIAVAVGGTLASGVEVGRTTFAQVAGNAVINGEIEFSIPSGTVAGNYNFYVVADPDNTIAEFSEANNSDIELVTVAEAYMDFGGFYSLTTEFAAGVQTTMGYRVTPFFGGPSNYETDVEINFWLSDDAILDSGDSLIGSDIASIVTVRGQGKRADASVDVLVSGDLAAGNYYLIAEFDPNNLVAEDYEDNNASYNQITVVEPNSDLAVSYTEVAFPPNAGSYLTGETASATSHIQNNGNVDASGVTVDYYISTDLAFSNDDVLLGSDVLGDLAADDDVSSSLSFTVPATLSTADYYVLAIVSDQGAILDSFTADNTAIDIISVTAATFDVSVDSVYVEPAAINWTSYDFFPGEQFNLDFDISNSGTVFPSDLAYEIYYSNDGTLDGGDALVGSGNVDISDGFPTTVYETLTMPTNGVTAGTGTFFVSLDPNDVYSDLDTSDNIGETQANVVIPSYDVGISGFYSADSVISYVAGDSLGWAADIQSLGTQASSGASIEFYLSQDTTLDSGDLFVGSETFNLDSGDFDTVYGTFALPQTLANGDYYMISSLLGGNLIDADATNDVSVYSVPITVVDAPTIDMTVTTVTTGAAITLGAGQAGSIDLVVDNLGNTDSDEAIVQVYLSLNGVLDANAILIGSDSVFGVLAGGDFAISIDVDLPAGLVAGDYTVISTVLHQTTGDADPSNDVDVSNQIVTVTVPDFTTGDDVVTLLTDFNTYGLAYAMDGNDTVYGSVGDDGVFGEQGDDHIFGGGGLDYLSGGAGVDTMEGGDDSDLMEGGDGWDDLRGGNGDDFVYGGRGDDVLRGGNGNDVVSGEKGNDEIHGAKGNDLLLGGDKTDILYGGSGADEIKGGNGNDLIYAGTGDDKARGGTGDDKLYGENGRDLLLGDVGNDKIYGGGKSDEIYGGDGDDFLDGGSSADTIGGGNGADEIRGGTGHDLMSGGSGADSIRGGNGDDRMSGGNGNDTIFGDNGADMLYGGGKSDIMSGGKKADMLDGGSGKDIMSGGEGSDDFIFDDGDSSTVNSKRDVITDFSSGDEIDLSSMDANTTNNGDDTFVFSGTSSGANSIWYSTNGTNAVVMGDQDGDGQADFEIQLLGVTNLQANDFIL